MCRRRLSLRRYAEKAIQTESSRTEIYTELGNWKSIVYYFIKWHKCYLSSFVIIKSSFADNGEIVQVKSEPQGVTTTTTKSSQVDLPRKTKMMREGKKCE